MVLRSDTPYSLGCYNQFDGFNFKNKPDFDAPDAGGSLAFAEPSGEL